MSTQTLVKKLDKEVKNLKGDIRDMKKFLFTPLKDAEGEYKASFVKKILARSQKQASFYRFTDKETFRNHARSKK